MLHTPCNMYLLGKPRITYLVQYNSTIDEVPSARGFVLLGDFNARIGSREGSESEWYHTQYTVSNPGTIVINNAH